MKRFTPQLFIILAIGCLILLIRYVMLGKLTGTFQKHMVPTEYYLLEQFLDKQKHFSRTLWIPTVQRFGLNSQIHPMVDGYNFFRVASPAGVLALLPQSEQALRDSSVGYIIVPFDSEGEIFLKDRKYDANAYQQIVADVRKITWLTEVPGFERIHVFAVKNPQDHFWSTTNPSLISSYDVHNPTQYVAHLQNTKKGDALIFSEGYDPYWQLMVDGRIISSKEYHQLNSFLIPKNGTYDITVSYKPQEWVNIGLWISGSTVIVIIGLLIILSRQRNSY